MASSKSEIQELKEIMLNMQNDISGMKADMSILEKNVNGLEKGRKEDRKYLDKKLKQQTEDVYEALDQQSIDNRKDLNKIKDDINGQQEKLYFEYKSDFYTKVDPILKEVVDSRQDRTVLSHRVSKIGDELQISA